jgi:DNA-binding NarL/FixJ family response regulator
MKQAETAQGEKIVVAIADDHMLFRIGLGEILSSFDEIDLKYSVSNGKELVDKIYKDKKPPHVCILDINMPVMDGYTTAKRLKEINPRIKIIALSMYDNDDNVIKMMRNGATGYMLKDTPPDELREAIRSMHKLGYYHSELITNDLLKAAKQPVTEKDELAELSGKELKFLKLCCSELTYKDIAEQMGVSPRTVDGYRDSLFDKLNIRTRTGLALYAVRTGLVALY